MKYIIALLISIALLSSCNQNETTTQVPITDENDSSITPEDIIATEAKYIWLSQDEAINLAKENGVDFRIVSIDGQSMPVTMDYRPGRINASVEDGIVVSYNVEG